MSWLLIENCIVIILFAGSAAYFGIKAYRAVFKRPGQGGCAGCSGGASCCARK